MKFVAARCPACNGELQVPDNKDFIKCMYCGVDVKVRDAISVNFTTNTSNLKELANSSMKSGNYEESYNYFTKILEYEIKNHEAWFGKGVSASRLSTLANPRHKEMLNYFDNAIKYYSGDDINGYKEQITNTVLEFCRLFFQTSKNHKDDFITVDSTWPEYVAHCNELIEVLEYTGKNYTASPNVYKGIKSICQDNLDGTFYFEEVYINNGYKNVQKRKMVSDNHRQNLLKKSENAYQMMRKLNPDYWSKYDEWYNESKRITKNNNIKLLYVGIGLFVGSIAFFAILNLLIGSSSKKSDNLSGIFTFLVFIITIVGIVVAQKRFKKNIPSKPKE